MGRPVNLTPAQLELLRQHSEPAFSFTRSLAKKGLHNLSFDLKPGEVQYFEISIPSDSATTRFLNAEEFKIWDKAMGERSK
jgi:hypothetical protein